MSKQNRDGFIAFVNGLKSAFGTLNDDQLERLRQKARQNYGLTAKETEQILEDLGLTVINYFEVLGLTIEELENHRSEEAIKKRVQDAWAPRYQQALRDTTDRGVERRNLLNNARNTLKDPQKLQAHIDKLVPTPAPLRFPNGDEASTPEEFAKLIDRHWEVSKTLLYDGDDVQEWLVSVGETKLVSITKDIISRYSNQQDIGLEELVQKLDPQIGKPKLQVHPSQIDFGSMDTESQKTVDIQITNVGRGFLYGDVWVPIDMPGLQVSDTKIQGGGVVSVKLDASQLTPDETYQTTLVLRTNGGIMRVPVSCSVIPKETFETEVMPDVNTKDADGNTPLHLAATKNDYKRVEMLLSHGADVNAKGKYGETPLHKAARQNASNTAEILLKNGAEVNARDDEDSDTPLRIAAGNNASYTTEVLLGNGADVNAKNKYGNTPLHRAAWQNASNIAEILLKNGADINAKSNANWTPLHEAAKNNASETAEILLKNGADINAKNNRDETPLNIASNENASETEAVLHKYGKTMSSEKTFEEAVNAIRVHKYGETMPDVNTKDADGNTPLHFAARKGNHKRVEVLLKNGADVNAENKKGTRPLHLAAERNADTVMEVLLKNGADVNAKNKHSDTPLHSAAYYNADKAIGVLLKNGADINANDYIASTPLHDTAHQDAVKAAEVLLKNGADVEGRRDADRWHTPLHKAALYNAHKTAEVLLRNGADVNAKNSWGETPLRVAVDNSANEVVEVLRRYGGKKGIFW